MEQELSDVLVVLADRLGVAAEAVFGIFVGAQPLIGVIAIAANILGILAACLTARYVHKKLVIIWHDKDGDWVDDELSIWEPVVVAIVFAVGLFVFVEMFVMLGDCVLRIVAPEYMAVKEIIGILKP